MSPYDRQTKLDGINVYLIRKVKAILSEINRIAPPGWKLDIFETWRTPERQLLLFNRGYSKTKNSLHIKGRAVDLVWRHNGIWTWSAPYLTNNRNGWRQLDICRENHGLRNLSWDKPHCQI